MATQNLNTGVISWDTSAVPLGLYTASVLAEDQNFGVSYVDWCLKVSSHPRLLVWQSPIGRYECYVSSLGSRHTEVLQMRQLDQW